MDFFEQQRRARRWTGWLILAFILAIFVVGLGVHSGVMTFIMATDKDWNGTYFEGFMQHPLSWPVFLWSQFVVLFIVCLGSLCKVYDLYRGGGEYVAEMLGGTEVSPFTFKFEEKQLLNIVEEMSIAAGIVVPAVYILEKEYRINSFSAGFDQDSAVIGLTRGALDYLNRDEIQAIAAHEFSHILNGDIVLNMRMIGVLFGLGMVTQLGLAMSLRNADIEDEDLAAVMVLLAFNPLLLLTFGAGLICMLLGSIGWILGAFIKTAISRQREYLADSAAVQYTRNPGALKSTFLKIGSPRVSSLVYSAHAVEASHIFIGNIWGQPNRWNPFSSHPDWTRRIREIDPTFKGKFPLKVQRIRHRGLVVLTGHPDEAMIDELLSTTNPRLNRFLSRTRMNKARNRKTQVASTVLDDLALFVVGEGQTGQNKEYGDRFVKKMESITLSPVIADALKTPQGCCTLICALLLEKDENIRKRQIDELSVLTRKMRSIYPDWIRQVSEAIVKDFSIEKTMAKSASARKLRSAFIRIRNRALRDGLPKLRELSKDDYADFRRICSHLTGDVNKINLFRYSLFAAFRHELDPLFEYGNHKIQPAQFHAISAVEPSLRLALSYLAYAGHADHGEATAAFQAGLRQAKLSIGGLEGTLLPLTDCSFRTLDESFRIMQQATLPIREKCLEAFRTVLWNDGKMTAREEEIYLAAEAMLKSDMTANKTKYDSA